MAHAARGGVLGGGSDEHERTDTPVGGMAADRTVRGRRHGDDHLLQAVRGLSAPKVPGTALGCRAEVPAGRSATGGPQRDERKQNCR